MGAVSYLKVLIFLTTGDVFYFLIGLLLGTKGLLKGESCATLLRGTIDFLLLDDGSKLSLSAIEGVLLLKDILDDFCDSIMLLTGHYNGYSSLINVSGLGVFEAVGILRWSLCPREN